MKSHIIGLGPDLWRARVNNLLKNHRSIKIYVCKRRKCKSLYVKISSRQFYFTCHGENQYWCERHLHQNYSGDAKCTKIILNSLSLLYFFFFFLFFLFSKIILIAGHNREISFRINFEKSNDTLPPGIGLGP